MSRDEIIPTYRVPALVRAPGHQVDLRGVEPLTSPVREKQSSIRLPAQTSDFPAQTADSTVINDHELPPVRTSDDDQMMTKLQQVAVADPLQVNGLTVPGA